jgi:hypothetical protein
MAKLMLLVFGMLALAGTVLMVRAAPDRAGAVLSTMDIQEIEKKMDLNALPKRDLDPAIYQ